MTPNTRALAGGVTEQTAAAFSIGARPNGTNGVTARMGPVAMWRSAAGGGGVLTADQRAALYNAGAGLAYASFTA